MSRVAIYKRVSTDHQDLGMQDHAIGEWMARRPAPASVCNFQDVGISGKTDRRPGYQALCAAVAAGEIDTVVVYRLDRLSRNALSAIGLLATWLQQGVEFFATDSEVLQLGKDNPFRMTFLSLYSEIAQVERETIVARVRTGLAAAKARGVRLGASPKLTPTQVAQGCTMLANGSTYRDIGKALDVSHTTARRACMKGTA